MLTVILLIVLAAIVLLLVGHAVWKTVAAFLNGTRGR